jgi:hypothetical protein
LIIDIDPCALEAACDLYRVSLYSQLVGREPPGRLLVTDAELCEAIPESFAAVGEAEYQDILDDSAAAPGMARGAGPAPSLKQKAAAGLRSATAFQKGGRDTQPAGQCRRIM